MTLVLTCLTRNAVFQVSDRRLTRFGSSEIIDDETNKAVIVEGRVAFGYTGLAKIGVERSDDWLARVVASGPTDNMAQVARRVKDEATKDFERIGHPRRAKYHAFQGAGWFRLRDRKGLTPGAVTIENGFDHHTGAPLPDPLREFRVSTCFPEEKSWSCDLTGVGVVPSPEEKSAVIKLVRKCVKHRHATDRTILHALILSMRWLSARHEEIGPGLMAVCLPKKCAEDFERSGQSMILAGPPTDYAATFFYVSATGSKAIFGPHFVGGGSIWADFVASSA